MRKMPKQSAYRILGIDPNANIRDIKTAYRTLALKYHPDIASSPYTNTTFLRITEAYQELISDDQKSDEKKPEPSPKHRAADFDTVARMGKMLLESRSKTKKIFAAKYLGNSKKKSAYTYLRKGLYDPEDEVVQEVLEAIGKLRILHSIGDLNAAFTSGTPVIKRAILKTVGVFGKKVQGVNNIILLGLRDADPDIRRYALDVYAKNS
ncbi:MAG: DnaJ domain-containing protein [Spirochaetia bacterium]